MPESVSLDLGGRTFSIEVGKVAKQASGSAWVRYGDTVVLVAAVASKYPIDKDFFPLSVEYREKTYAAGKIPGGFFKREGRPTEKEILSSRLIDRPLRPLFPDGFRNEIQISATVLSSDQANDSDILGITGASVALMVSDIPFPEPVSGVRVGFVEGKLVLNPTFQELEQSALDMVVAGTDSSIVMVEGGAREVPEATVVEALRFAHKHILELNKIQVELRRRIGKPKREFAVPPKDAGLEAAVEREFGDRVRRANEIQTKEERQAELDRVKEEALAKFEESHPDMGKQIATILEHIESQDLRRRILKEGRRADGRGPDDIRAITCEVGVLPRTHGSALFTRGQTQSLVATTLGTKVDEQRVEELEGQSWKSYMLHYNFPPFSVGEVRPMRGPGRREIGHGALAERAIEPLIPSDIDFPYTIRVVSDILESNGSSSMATVCGGSLSLMDAGVPIKAHVAGIAMGLIKDGNDIAILTDILGVEDHLGDMDFKVTGTREGITAFQMDIKIEGLSMDIMSRALEKARVARMHVLGKMEAAIATPRAELSPYAPRIYIMMIDPDKIREVIGPGGKMIKKISAETGTQIDIEDSGEVRIAAFSGADGDRARDIIRSITEDPEVGRIYSGIVRRVVPFGAFVEISPGKDGLVHISELEPHRVERVEDVINEGDTVLVKVIGIDREGKIKLSRKQALPGYEESGDHEAQRRPPGGGGERPRRKPEHSRR
ncbi:MAG: polyribonucleotide nucleotidyltransferase [Candidatus Eisenbacteria bacterium]|uniref:Polyribonucleotide nucleotidyltransferase n=1 Tax=Eiseniibacteriota bacterium TaxID=2212470 RepID=A0A538T8W3_UNCEI|nr:MAG: polyribonucleotide nucleotidyltransferase [Candidatus Eisenbacteria bacterium]